MTKKLKTFLLCVILLGSVNFSYSQTNEINIKFIGNCGIHLSDGKMNVYLDFPYKSGAFNYMEYDAAELDSVPDNSIFIYTHKHGDHYSKKLARKMKRNKKGKIFGNWNVEKLAELNSIENEFSITYFETDHRFSFKHYSFLITWHGKKFYFSGDTEHAETIGAVTGIDYSFVPYWLLVDANEKKIDIDSKIKVVYHLYPNQKITGEIPKDIILFDQQGKRIVVNY